MQKNIIFIIIIIFFASQLHASEGYVAKKPKSVMTGLNWSICSTIFPVGVGTGLVLKNDAGGWIALGGILLGPSAGHFYAHQWLRGLVGISLRTAVTGGLFVSIANNLNSEDYVGDLTKGLVWIGSMVVLSIYDIATVPNSVKKYNNNLEKTNKLHFIPNLDIRNKKYGLSLVYNF